MGALGIETQIMSLVGDWGGFLGPEWHHWRYSTRYFNWSKPWANSSSQTCFKYEASLKTSRGLFQPKLFCALTAWLDEMWCESSPTAMEVKSGCKQGVAKPDPVPCGLATAESRTGNRCALLSICRLGTARASKLWQDVNASVCPSHHV